MALFDSRPRRILKNVQKLASENMVDQAAVKVEQEYRSMIESKEVARELVAFLMDVGYPDLAARISEDIIRTHRDLREPILKHLEDRHGEFPRSFELLRTLWQEKVKGLDFAGAIALLNRVDRTAEAKLFEMLESTARSAEKYSMGERLLSGDVDKFLGWSLALHRKGKNREALEVLAKVSEKIDERDSRIPQLIDWISTRRGGRDPEATLFLIKSYIGMENLEAALTAVPVMYEAPIEIVTEAIAVVEKDIVPKDLSHRSRVYLARLLGVVERFDDACRGLEQLIDEDHIDEEVGQAVGALVRQAPDRARPLLVQARFKRAAGETTAAIDSIEKAFSAEDATESPIAEVCKEFLSDGVDREGTVARGLASFLTENGSISEAVEALGSIVVSESDWVVAQLQKLLVRRKDSAEALTLLAIAMQLQGREADADRTLRHLQERQDHRSQEDMLLVLDRFDDLMSEYPGLRKIRARVRWSAGHRKESSGDWLRLLMAGEDVHTEAVAEIIRNDLHREAAAEIVESGFTPSTPLQAFLLASACLGTGRTELASEWLPRALEEKSLAKAVARELLALDDIAVQGLEMSRFLPQLAASGASKAVSSILLKTHGKEEWRVSLISGLSWGEPAEEVEFRLRALIPEGLLSVAGAAIEGLNGATIDDPALLSLGRAAGLIGRGSLQEGLQELRVATENPARSTLARTMLLPLVDEAGPLEPMVRLEIADTLFVEEKIREAVAVLSEMDPDNPGLVERMERIVSEKSPDPDALLLLSRSMRARRDEESFKKYAGMLLDVSSENGSDIAELAASLGDETGSAQALVFAADTIDRFGLEGSSEQLLMKAIGLDRSIADQLAARKGASPAFQALCYLASTDGARFADMMRRRSGLEIPVDREMIDRAREAWKPGRDDQALWFLSEVAGRTGFDDDKLGILSSLAREGIGGWGADASKELLMCATRSEEARPVFWRSVSNREVLEEALATIAPTSPEGSTEELGAVGEAVVRIGLSAAQTAAICRLLVDSQNPDLRPLARDLGKLCYEQWRKDPESVRAEDMVGMLVSVGLSREGSEAGLSIGSNAILAELRKSLERLRSTDDPSLEPSVRARMRLDTGDYEGCLSLLSSLSGEELDAGLVDELTARALWGLGRREAAIARWIGCYRRTGDPACLQKIHWACGASGHHSEQAGIGRAIAMSHPEHAVGLERPEQIARQLRLIGG